MSTETDTLRQNEEAATMSACRLFYRGVTEDGRMPGIARAEAYCETHGMSGFAPVVTSTGDAEMDGLCPVGKVELATERGLAKIAAATRKIENSTE